MTQLKHIFSDKRLLIILLLGFSSGLPLALLGTGGTFQAWLTDSGLSVKTLGNLSTIMLPYALKFLWAPFLDRYIAPAFSTRGRRQSWMLLTQIAIAAVLTCMGILNPAQDFQLLIILAALAAFASASQDIVIDAYRAEVLEPDELGPGASVAILGYRLGMLTSGALALSMGQFLPWRTVYWTMALVQLIGFGAAWFAPQSRRTISRPASLREAVVEPLSEFLNRRGAIELLAFVLLYKIGDVMAALFTTRFMLDIGFQKVDIAAVVKGFGLAATIVGSLLGGIWLAMLGMKRALIVLGVVQAFSILAFAILALAGKNQLLMILAIACENFGSGLGTAAFTAFLMGLCDSKFTGTQYALLTSLAGISRSLIGPWCGQLVELQGWSFYFSMAALASIPALFLVMFRFDAWQSPSSNR